MKTLFLIICVIFLFTIEKSHCQNAYFSSQILAKSNLRFVQDIYNYKENANLILPDSLKMNNMDKMYFEDIIEFMKYPLIFDFKERDYNYYILNRFSKIYSCMVNKSDEFYLKMRDSISKNIQFLKNKINSDSDFAAKLVFSIKYDNLRIDSISKKIYNSDTTGINSKLKKILTEFNLYDSLRVGELLYPNLKYFREIKADTSLKDSNDKFLFKNLYNKLDSFLLMSELKSIKADNKIKLENLKAENIKDSIKLKTYLIDSDDITKLKKTINNSALYENYTLEKNVISFEQIIKTSETYNNSRNESERKLQSLTVEAISGIIIDRFSSSLYKYALSELFDNLNKEELKTILPETVSSVENSNNGSYPDFHEKFMKSLKTDFNSLPKNILNVIDKIYDIQEKKYQEYLNSFPDDTLIIQKLKTIKSGKTHIKIFKTINHFIENNQYYDFDNQMEKFLIEFKDDINSNPTFFKYYHSIGLSYRIIKSLQISEKYDKPILVKKSDFLKINDATEIIYFLGLLKKDAPDNQILVDYIIPKKYYQMSIDEIQNKDDIQNVIVNNYNTKLLSKILDLIDNVQILTKLTASNEYNSADYIHISFKLLRSMANLYKFSENSSMKFEKFTKILDNYEKAYTSIYSRNYLGLLNTCNEIYCSFIIDSTESLNNVLKTLKYVELMESYATAKTSEDAKKILETFISNENDAYRNRNESAITISSSIGITGSKEYSDNLKVNGYSGSISIPLGIEISKLFGTKLNLFLQLFDFTAPVSYLAQNNDGNGLPDEIKFSQLFSPGICLNYMLSDRIPIDIGIFFQMNPQLRKIDIADNEFIQTNKFGVKISWDLPLVLIYK